jgi:hypothetical protein
MVELKAAFTVAGVQGEEVLLYLEDHQLADDGVMEGINSLLASGESKCRPHIPGLRSPLLALPLQSPVCIHTKSWKPA